MVEFSVLDMSCGHCASTITSAVKRVDAAAQVAIDLETKRVRIEGSTHGAREFEDSIRRSGYTPEPVA